MIASLKRAVISGLAVGGIAAFASMQAVPLCLDTLWVGFLAFGMAFFVKFAEEWNSGDRKQFISVLI